MNKHQIEIYTQKHTNDYPQNSTIRKPQMHQGKPAWRGHISNVGLTFLREMPHSMHRRCRNGWKENDKIEKRAKQIMPPDRHLMWMNNGITFGSLHWRRIWWEELKRDQSLMRRIV